MTFSVRKAPNGEFLCLVVVLGAALMPYVCSGGTILTTTLRSTGRNSTNATTTITTTSQNSTVSNATVAPINSTTPASMATTDSLNATTSVSNTTTPPSNATTLPSNTTTLPSNATTSPSNTTTPPSNTTTAPSNTTTAPSNTTTPPSNTTTPHSNTTTPTSNTTSPGTTTSTSTPSGTPSPTARWRVYDAEGKLCMLMDFTGTVSHYTKQQVTTIPIPEEVDLSKSKCDDHSESVFLLQFNTTSTIWQLYMAFTVTDKSFEFTTLSTSTFEKSGILNDTGSVTPAFDAVPLGSYYSCAWLNHSVDSFGVNLTAPIFQPFVQRTSSGSNLGKDFVCGSGGHSSSSQAGKIAAGIIVSLLIVGTAVAVTYFLITHRKPRDPPYTRVTN